MLHGVAPGADSRRSRCRAAIITGARPRKYSDLARLRWGDAGGRLPRGVRLRRGGLAQDQPLHEAQALRGHGPHLAGPRGAAWVQGARRRPRRPRLSRATTYWVETQTAGVGERCLDNVRCPCIGIRLNGSKTTLTTVYLLSLP